VDNKENQMADHDDMPYIVIERSNGGVGAFLIGALVGAGVALLFAPRPGDEVRGELRSGVRRMRDRAGQTVRELQSTVTDTIEGVRTEVTGRVDAAREAFEAGRQAARETRTDMERRVTETRARVRASMDAARRPAIVDAEGQPMSASPRPEPVTEIQPEADLGV
jgi:gas vesicle protein